MSNRTCLRAPRESLGICPVPAVLNVDDAPVADGQHLIAASLLISVIAYLG
jgi:hypothetical protein